MEGESAGKSDESRGRASYSSPQEVAALLRVTPNFIARQCREGEIRGIRVGRLWRIPEAEVRRIVGADARVSVGMDMPVKKVEEEDAQS